MILTEARTGVDYGDGFARREPTAEFGPEIRQPRMAVHELTIDGHSVQVSRPPEVADGDHMWCRGDGRVLGDEFS